MRNEATSAKTAVLLVNLGSPDAPTPKALRTYLAEFLRDKRVVDLPAWKWWPILYGIILNVRPKKSAHAYEKIWYDEGSPLIVITERQTRALQQNLSRSGLGHIIVDYAMRYGNPSLSSKFDALIGQGVEQVLVLPMYPQYSDVTIGSVYDGVFGALREKRHLPEIRFIRGWYDHPYYIQILADSARRYFAEHGRPQKLLLSYHGVPKRYLLEGDPYFCHCHKTSRLLAEALAMANDEIMMVFQSRFGKEEWLQPYADKTIEALPAQGVEHIAVMSPCFSADCLETLEEMAIGNRELFLAQGGKRYDYIPCLNDEAGHIELLSMLVKQHGQGWNAFSQDYREDAVSADIAKARRSQWEETGRLAR